MPSSSIDKKEIRKFGLIAMLFFGALCVLGIWHHKPLPIYLFGVLSLVGFGFILAPGPLKPLHSAWLKMAHVMARYFTIIVLALAYYIVITPFALLKRLFGGPPIPIKRNENRTTYWVTRSEPTQPKERFIKRF